MPFVSIIMACHNAGAYVSEAIKSVLDQTFKDLELIFVDDKSSDDSLAIARSFGQSDKRIKVFSSGTKLGPARARNLAIENSAGEWLAILDADDVFFRDKLERQIQIINRTGSNLVLIGTGVIQIQADGRPIAAYHYPLDSSRLKKRLMQKQAFPPHSSLIYRASTVRDIGGFNPLFSSSEDYDLWLRLSEVGDFSCLREQLILYRRHDTNISARKSDYGYSQMDFSLAASVCHALRQRGCFDPSAPGNPALWDKFMEHVARENAAAGEIDYRKWKQSWRDDTQFKTGRFANISSVLRNSFLKPGYALRLLKEHSVGTGAVTRCLDSWVKSL